MGRDRTFATNVSKAIRQYNPSCIRVNPGQLAELLSSDEISKLPWDSLSNIKTIHPVATTLPRAMEENVRKVFPAVTSVCINYGASEFGLVTHGEDHTHIGWVVGGCVLKVLLSY